jgi:hypothetical protein
MYEVALKRSVYATQLIALGGCAVASIVLITNAVPESRFMFEAQTLGPLVEELLKFLCAGFFIATVDVSAVAALYMVPLIGTSFGLFEALRHYQVYGVIGVWALAAHIIFAGIMSVCIYKARSGRQALYYSCALFVPALLHTMYNALVVPYYFG